jgi:hypothetical protein
MKKHGLRVLVGLIAFGLGVFSFWLIVLNSRLVERCERENNPEVLIINPSGNVEINFIGFGSIEKRPTLKFEIKNNFSFPVNYRAGEEGKPEIFLKIDEKEIDKITGLICVYERDFTLKENEFLKLEVFADELFFRHLKEKGKIKFGFRHHPFTDSEYTPSNFANYDRKIWSEPITISEKMKKDIIKNAPDFFYPNKEEKLQMMSPKQLAGFENF